MTQARPIRSSLKKVFSILETVSEVPGGLTLKEISERTAIPPSTISRIAGNLVALECLRKNSYHVFSSDIGLIRLGFRALKGFSIPADLVDILQSASEQTGANVALGTRSGLEAIFVFHTGRALSAQQIPAPSTYPLHCSPLAMTVLAGENLSPAERKKLLSASIKQSPDQPSAVSVTELAKWIAETEKAGHGVWRSGGIVNVTFSFPWRDRIYAVSLFKKTAAHPGELVRAGNHVVSELSRQFGRTSGRTISIR